MPPTDRDAGPVDLVERLATLVSRLVDAHGRVLVAVDGPDAAGKTTLADQIAAACSVPAVRASVDGFHRPRSMRYGRGELSAEGYYRDAFDHTALIAECLLPFRDGHDVVTTATFDLSADQAGVRTSGAVPARAVLVVDGVFLLREELRDLWTLSVHLRVSPRVTLRRAVRRDLDRFGSVVEVERRYLTRYLPAQSLYQAEGDPESVAHVVVDNEDPDEPVVERWDPGPPIGDR